MIDITARKIREAKMHRHATCDALNRRLKCRLLHDRLQQAIEQPDCGSVKAVISLPPILSLNVVAEGGKRASNAAS